MEINIIYIYIYILFVFVFYFGRTSAGNRFGPDFGRNLANKIKRRQNKRFYFFSKFGPEFGRNCENKYFGRTSAGLCPEK